jgi:hypothetical protein
MVDVKNGGYYTLRNLNVEHLNQCHHPQYKVQLAFSMCFKGESFHLSRCRPDGFIVLYVLIYTVILEKNN